MCRTGFMPRMLLNPHDVVQQLCQRNSEEYAHAALESASSDDSAPTKPNGDSSNQPTAAEACICPPSTFTSPSRFARLPVPKAVTLSSVPLNEPVTVFHSRTLPALSLFELGCEINQRIKCGEECLLIALVLMRRYCDKAKVQPTAHMMHRLYITCLHVGIKAHSDEFFTNAAFARVVGIEPRELIVLERELVATLGWKLQVNQEQIAAIIAVN
jgi:hypothetical protein